MRPVLHIVTQDVAGTFARSGLCICGSTKLSKLGEDVTETLEVVPRRWKVIQTVRERFSCRQCEAGRARRRGDHHPLARQMVGEGFARRPLALEGFDDGRGRRALRRQLVLRRVGLGVLQLHLQLVDEPLLAFRARAIERAPQLFDLQPQPRDQRLGARRGRVSVGEVGFHPRRARLALAPRRPLGEDQPVSSGEVAGERFGHVGHARERI